MEHNRMITILGPTASGKTSIAAALAGRIGGEIISADSRQVYRRMDIGTGKDLADYEVGGKHIPYHLIDIAEPGYKYNLFEYQRDFHTAYDDITSRGRTPVLCGGTGLYIEAVLNGYALSPVPQNQELRDRLSAKSLDELTAMLKALKEQTGSNMHNRSDVDTVQRAIRAIEIETYNLQHPTPEREMPGISSLVIGVDVDRETRRRRISDRLEARLHEGMIDEVKYKFVTEYVTGKTTYNDMLSRLEIAIHQFAKRQMTWFRGMERRGIHINWIDASLPMDDKVELIMELNEKKQ